MNYYTRNMGSPSQEKIERRKQRRIKETLDRVRKKPKSVHDLPFLSYPQKISKS